MASLAEVFSRRRQALHWALPRLYKFALALAANEEVARTLLRGTCKSLLMRRDWTEEDRDHLIDAFARMHALWTARLTDDPNIQRKYLPDPKLFSKSGRWGAPPGNLQFARFIVNLPVSERAVLYLVYGEGASYDEAADVLGLPIQALMRLVAQGHVALSNWLDRSGPAEDIAAGLSSLTSEHRDHWQERAA